MVLELIPNLSATDCPESGSMSSSITVPSMSASLRLLILEVKMILSPSRRKRGANEFIISVFWVTSVLVIDPVFRSFVWANPMNFHLVSDSGMVNSITVSPFSLVRSCGKKKAVSLKLVRTAMSSIPASPPRSLRMSSPALRPPIKYPTFLSASPSDDSISSATIISMAAGASFLADPAFSRLYPVAVVWQQANETVSS
ncbi:hypothetical protein SDC9_55860 [bioreactor metagenome]|uniref:Uncharacterized protein n=1 Tax=bioreactor metagenome TaxID=1076179 RepID=A0A644X073_9ZZZZ